MTNEQKKFLKLRLNEAYRMRREKLPKRYPSEHAKDKPKEVKSAEAQIRSLRKVVSRWEKKIKAKHDAADRRLGSDHRAALQALLFSDPKVALAAVEKFAKSA